MCLKEKEDRACLLNLLDKFVHMNSFQTEMLQSVAGTAKEEFF